MLKSEFRIKNPNSPEIFFRHWEAENPRALVCIVHGLGEHSKRYGHVADLFGKRGFVCLAIDLPGHGESEGTRGHATGLEAYLDGISALLETARSAWPELPIFLYGHSMGGNLVLNHALRRKPEINGVIATASWIRLPEPPSLLVLGFAKLVNRIWPSMTQSNGLNVKYISTDPDVVEAYIKDSLVHDRISVALALSMVEAAGFLDSYDGVFPVPLLLMHGQADSLTLPNGSAEFLKRAKGDITWKEWEGMYHEIHNEPEKMEVLSFILQWMDSRV